MKRRVFCSAGSFATASTEGLTQAEEENQEGSLLREACLIWALIAPSRFTRDT